MNDTSTTGLRRWYKAQKPDSIARNLLMNCLVATGAAFVVSTAAVLLQPRHAAQLAAAREASMSTLINSIPALKELVLSSGASSLRTELVDLDSGCFVSDRDVLSFDPRAAEIDPASSTELDDAAGDSKSRLKRRADMQRIHLLFHDDTLQLAILPVHGPGYQSTLYAWLVLEGDLDTIAALQVHEHGETPGIGSRVENVAWQQQWIGKHLYDEHLQLAINVVKQGSDSPTLVNGISGATRTSQGVSNMVRFWVGEFGFGPFLDRLRRGDMC